MQSHIGKKCDTINSNIIPLIGGRLNNRKSHYIFQIDMRKILSIYSITSYETARIKIIHNAPEISDAEMNLSTDAGKAIFGYPIVYHFASAECK